MAYANIVDSDSPAKENESAGKLPSVNKTLKRKGPTPTAKDVYDVEEDEGPVKKKTRLPRAARSSPDDSISVAPQATPKIPQRRAKRATTTTPSGGSAPSLLQDRPPKVLLSSCDLGKASTWFRKKVTVVAEVPGKLGHPISGAAA